jgi:internalin A
MRSRPEGLAIALARIADEKTNRTGFLDLGRLGLTEVPKELFELEHLWGLNWGSSLVDQRRNQHEAASDLDANQYAELIFKLQRLPALTLVSVSGTDVSDLSPLAQLQSLRSLD